MSFPTTAAGVRYPLRFGFCVPIFAMPGAQFFRTPAWEDLDPPAAVEAAVVAEQLGFDSVWMADHLIHGHDGGILEGWTTLCVIAGRTQRVRLGTIHMAQALRGPAMSAKIAATLDSLTGGRFIMFYDWGGEFEAHAYGLPYPPEDERVPRLEEGIRLIKAMWAADGPLDFPGKYYSTDAAICLPKPVQRPHPPIWIGEARSDAWLDMVARQADGWNSVPATPERLRERLDRVRAACERAGRNPAELEISLEMQILIAPTEREAKVLARRISDIPTKPRAWSQRPTRPPAAAGAASTASNNAAAGRAAAQQAQGEALLEYLHSDADTRPLSALVPNWPAHRMRWPSRFRRLQTWA